MNNAPVRTHTRVVTENLTQYGADRRLCEDFLETARTTDVVKVANFITALLIKEIL